MFIDYQLIDSGNLTKLERYGDVVLIRPTSTALWSPKKTATEWSALSSASFNPPNTWVSGIRQYTTPWEISIKNNLKMILRLQSNGQIGIFPEHASYLECLTTWTQEFESKFNRLPNVLNLFAYTGLASICLLELGCQVTHVELQANILDWFSQNLEANNLSSNSKYNKKLRIVKDDAYAFVRKERGRKSTYDLIIADPPSFSRLGKNKTVKLVEVAPSFIEDLSKITGHMLLITNHDTTLPAETIVNLFQAHSKHRSFSYSIERLKTRESSSSSFNFARDISYGYLVKLNSNKL
jgi:23S rRNA (cytosine1962-C5)-methyltransferase